MEPGHHLVALEFFGHLKRGWEVPVLEGYSASITMAKLMVDLGVNASGITYMGDHQVQLPDKIHV